MCSIYMPSHRPQRSWDSRGIRMKPWGQQSGCSTAGRGLANRGGVLRCTCPGGWWTRALCPPCKHTAQTMQTRDSRRQFRWAGVHRHIRRPTPHLRGLCLARGCAGGRMLRRRQHMASAAKLHTPRRMQASATRIHDSDGFTYQVYVYFKDIIIPLLQSEVSPGQGTTGCLQDSFYKRQARIKPNLLEKAH